MTEILGFKKKILTNNFHLFPMFFYRQIWLNSSTPGSGWRGLGFESGSYKKVQFIPYTMNLQTKCGILQEAGCLIR